MAMGDYLDSFADQNQNSFERDDLSDCLDKIKGTSLIDVTSSTNMRTTFAAVVPPMPHGHSAPILRNPNPVELSGVLNSFAFDWAVRLKLSGLHLLWAVLEDLPLPLKNSRQLTYLTDIVSNLNLSLPFCSIEKMQLQPYLSSKGFQYAATIHERVRRRICLETIIGALFQLHFDDMRWILLNCDLPQNKISAQYKGSSLNVKGFWRVDKDKDPELRQTVLTLVAFHDLEEKIHECSGDRDKGIEAFLYQNDGKGWMLPETLRLADYDLGHDDRAKENQPVASRFGPRFYDWQLAQSPEESWRECHLHARNLLGQNGYLNLLGEVLRDTAAGGWSDALKFACDMTEKQSLVRLFSIALGFLPPEVWETHFEEIRTIALDRKITFEPADRIQVIVGALKKMAKESRSEGIAVAKGILGETDFIIALEKLLASVPCRADHPWHEIIRQKVGESVYQKITADLEMETPNQVAEAQANYSAGKKKMTQRGLFD
jgi:hypothetical protein